MTVERSFQLQARCLFSSCKQIRIVLKVGRTLPFCASFDFFFRRSRALTGRRMIHFFKKLLNAANKTFFFYCGNTRYNPPCTKCKCLSIFINELIVELFVCRIVLYVCSFGNFPSNLWLQTQLCKVSASSLMLERFLGLLSENWNTRKIQKRF